MAQKKNFTAAIPAAQFVTPEDLPDVPAKTPVDRQRKPDGTQKNQRMTFLTTPATMADLEAIVNLYRLRGIKMENKTVTINALLNAAVADYVQKHAAEIREYRDMIG